MSVIQAQTASKELKFVRCDDEGRLTTNLEATIDDVLMKGETSGGVKTPILCAADGKLEVLSHVQSGVAISTINSGGHLPSGQGVISLGLDNDGSGTARAIATTSTGRQEVVAFGNTNPADPSSGVFEVLHTDGSGNLNTQIISTVNVAPSNDNNAILTNSPTKADAVGLFARTDVALGSSTVPLKCSASGVLEVSSSGGGGSANTNLYPTLASITTATNFAGGIVQSNYINLENARNVVVNCIHTGNATARSDFGQDIAFSMEFTDDNTATTCYSGASTPVFAFSTLDAAGDATGDAVAVLSLGDRGDAGGSITGKFGRVVCVNNNNSGTNTAFAVTFKVVIDGI